MNFVWKKDGSVLQWGECRGGERRNCVKVCERERKKQCVCDGDGVDVIERECECVMCGVCDGVCDTVCDGELS